MFLPGSDLNRPDLISITPAPISVTLGGVCNFSEPHFLHL